MIILKNYILFLTDLSDFLIVRKSIVKKGFKLLRRGRGSPVPNFAKVSEKNSKT